jgi:hypothetical protein
MTVRTGFATGLARVALDSRRRRLVGHGFGAAQASCGVT